MKKQSIIRFSSLALLATTFAGCEKPMSPPIGGIVYPAQNLFISTVLPSSGGMGDIIQIDGSGFSDYTSANVVRFGEVAGVVSYASATRLEVRVPFDAETNNVAVEANGLSTTSPDIFTVNHSLPVFRGEGSDEMDNLSAEFARVSSTLMRAGTRSIIQHGHVWSSFQSSPGYNDSPEQTVLGAVNDNWGATYKFSSPMEGLQPNTTYTVRPYVMTKDGGVTYGPSSQFTTQKRYP